MEIIRTVRDLVIRRQGLCNKVNEIGFVPTMGALHKGHISLVNRSTDENEITIVSVFVNPKQFNDKSDFEKYPVEENADAAKLESAGCDILFMPQKDDIYNDYSGFEIDFDGLDEIYEGEFRPGHFQGVIDIVYRLFDIVKPNNAYFGQKDFQQLAAIRLLNIKAGLGINIVSCAIVREENGLAMSSRNERLSSDSRQNASDIYSLMLKVQDMIKTGDSTLTFKNVFMNEIRKNPDMKPEYCIFCNPNDLSYIFNVEKNAVIVMCVAVWCTNVRLIDNIILEF
jgi:pantoate--beta-alanine ligase